jgi:intermediate peptidase
MIGRRHIGSWIRNKSEVYPRGLFGIVGLHQPSDFSRIAHERVAQADATMDAWRQGPKPTPKEDIEVIDDVSNSLCQIADSAEFIRSVHSDPQWIRYASDAVETVSGFMSRANIDSHLFQRTREILRSIQNDKLVSDEYRKVISAMSDSMQNEGVHLDDQKKSILLSLQEKDVVKSFNVVNGKSRIYKEEGIWVALKDTPSTAKYLRLLTSRRNGDQLEYLIPPSASSIVQHLLRFVPCSETRARIWQGTHMKTDATRAKEEELHELIQIRRDLAKLRGYNSWNEYAQRESVLTPLGGPSAVERFLSELWVDISPGLEQELKVLEDLNGGSRIEPWDLDFLIQEWKDQNRASIASIQEIQSRLSFQRVIAGGQSVLRKVFDIDLQFDPTAGQLWHRDAFRLSLARGSSSPFAYLYVDPYERDTKSVQSAQFTISGSKVLRDGSRQIPQTALVLSLPRDPTQPLPIAVAQTFFHELGHSTHSLLSETNLQHFSGSRGSIDFVEFPSHLFEYFATEPECLRELIGPNMDPSYIEDYSKNRNPFAHIEVAQQLTYAMVDQVYYATGSPTNLESHLPPSGLLDRKHTLSLLEPMSTANFEHLVHYGGSYYCYLLCRALAAQVWDGAFRSNPWSRESGRRLEGFLRKGSVDQSLRAIFTIIPSKDEEVKVSVKALLKDLKGCSSIHSR